MVFAKFRKALRKVYLTRTTLLAVAALTVLTFIVFQSKIELQTTHNVKLNIINAQLTTQQDPALEQEEVDDKKFVLSNLESNLPKETTIKVLEMVSDDNPKETIVPKHVHNNMGQLDVHQWDGVCSFSINSMRQFPLFPLRAKSRKKINISHELSSSLIGAWQAQRIMGYLHPPVNGYFQFELSSFFMSELWLSENENPRKVNKISQITRNKLYDVFFTIGDNSPKSKSIFLSNNTAYYFEILHVINNVKTKEDHVRLSWKMPKFNDFTSIKREHVSAFIDDQQQDSSNLSANFRLEMSRSLNVVNEDDLKNETDQNINLDVFQSILAKKSNISRRYTKENVQGLQYLDQSDINSAFLTCPYQPSYTKKRSYKRYEGVYSTHFTEVFPNDGTTLLKEGYKDPTGRDGNTLIDEKEVFGIVKMFIDTLKGKFPNKYALEDILNVEKNVDQGRGIRYFLELAIRNLQENRVYRTAEYVYKFTKNPNKLFLPQGLRWKHNVTINVILTVKKQGDWVINFIKDMSRIKRNIHEHHLNLIVVDYGGDGVDVEQELKKSDHHNFTVVRRHGVFHKTSAINQAASLITDPNSIVFLMDLHLQMPDTIFDTIRKHTVQGKMSFTPVVFRLQFCGRPKTWNTYGSGWWETSGYGLFSIFKSDWDKFGGMNVKDFKNKWGGEDWEMVDRVLSTGIEIERLRVPELYHFFHDRSKMWEKSGHKR